MNKREINSTLNYEANSSFKGESSDHRIVSAKILRRNKTYGVSTEGQEQRAKLCSSLISDSIFWLFYFPPTLASRCNALPKKAPKELYTKIKTATDKRRRRFFDTFLYLLGSTTIPWVREFS